MVQPWEDVIDDLMDPTFNLSHQLIGDIAEDLDIVYRARQSQNEENYYAEVFEGVDLDMLETSEAFTDIGAWEKIKRSNKKLPKEVWTTKIEKKHLTTYQKLIGWDEIELYQRTYILGPKKWDENSRKRRDSTKPANKKRSQGGKRVKLTKQVEGLTELKNELKDDECGEHFGMRGTFWN